MQQLNNKSHIYEAQRQLCNNWVYLISIIENNIQFLGGMN